MDVEGMQHARTVRKLPVPDGIQAYGVIDEARLVLLLVDLEVIGVYITWDACPGSAPPNAEADLGRLLGGLEDWFQIAGASARQPRREGGGHRHASHLDESQLLPERCWYVANGILDHLVASGLAQLDQEISPPGGITHASLRCGALP